MMAVATRALDPVRYEIFAHRLWMIGEEGRMALQRVSASPIVVQGGECMQSFYDPGGRMVLACSGHLRFAAATSDAIRRILEWFGESPGFWPGDQIFFNDPYVAGSHTYDQMVIKPIFVGDQLVAWTASSSHTADTGGVLRGAASEIYHEGIRVLGLKVVERGEFRQDVCKTLVEQCRDPHYVELDLRSRIAGNNVSSDRFQQLVDQLGLEFVEAACAKLIEDAELQARAKIRSLPDGRWTSRMYATGKREPEPYQIFCRMTKRDDELEFDFDGTSPELNDDQNSTLPSSTAHITLALTNMLFWDLPWSDGKMAPVRIYIPEGSVLNCRFPAACGGAPRVGQVLVSAVSDCVAKMLYAGGRDDDVNAGWQGNWYEGGPGFFYGGHNREGVTVAQGLYDIHGGGFGATPVRDGVDTGGHANIPSGGISDVERIELQYPFLYLTRNHNPNGGGYGRFQGGDGSHRIYVVYGSKDLNIDYREYAGIPNGGFGLFGGYPAGTGGLRAIYRTDPERFRARLASGEYPTGAGEILEDGWGEIFLPERGRHRVPVPEFWIISDFVQGGGGFGDPLDRPPEAVAEDVARGVLTAWAAERFFGVRLDDGQADHGATAELRAEIRRNRLAGGSPTSQVVDPGVELEALDARPHAGLELARANRGTWWRCKSCGHTLGLAAANYKDGCIRRVVPLAEVSEFPLPAGAFVGQLHEYVCPGCASLLQVDVFCPAVAGEPDVHDIALADEGRT